MRLLFTSLQGLFIIFVLVDDFAEHGRLGLLILMELLCAAALMFTDASMCIKHRVIHRMQTIGRFTRIFTNVAILFFLLLHAIAAVAFAVLYSGFVSPELSSNYSLLIALYNYLLINFYLILLLFCHGTDHNLCTASFNCLLLCSYSLLYLLNHLHTYPSALVVRRGGRQLRLKYSRFFGAVTLLDESLRICTFKKLIIGLMASCIVYYLVLSCIYYLNPRIMERVQVNTQVFKHQTDMWKA
ncbi:hypothetical protein PAPHI01_1467 [Pancytospora philotis]|nr:hypothetical protein PAPHI01_1467 [Pancytospora philotis]